MSSDRRNNDSRPARPAGVPQDARAGLDRELGVALDRLSAEVDRARDLLASLEPRGAAAGEPPPPDAAGPRRKPR